MSEFEPLIEERRKRLAVRLEQLAGSRNEQYLRLARTVAPMLSAADKPDLALYALLIDAYHDGGRDVYEQVEALLEPLWKAAGLEP